MRFLLTSKVFLYHVVADQLKRAHCYQYIHGVVVISVAVVVEVVVSVLIPGLVWLTP